MLRHIFIILAATANSAALAHPVSHTDAWVTISDGVEVRLNVFLDDVIRHQLQIDETILPAESVEAAIRQHTGTLLQQLCIFQRGIPLTGRVTSLPSWRPKKQEVDLEADASLKLTWNLRFELTDPDVSSLCFVHHFTHESLTKPGELRLNLRRQGADRRISAAIPPARPFTVVVPGGGSASEMSDAGVNANVAVSRLVIAPSAVVHEFTAPLLLLDNAWPAAAQLRTTSLSSEEGASIAVFLNEAEVQFAKTELADWFRANVSISSGTEIIKDVGIDVEFFPDGPDSEISDADSSAESGLPLYGTIAGIRVRYPPQRSVESLKIAFARNPGLFDGMTVEKIDGLGQTSELLDFVIASSDQRHQPALQYDWEPSPAFASSPVQGLQKPAPEVLVQQLVTEEAVRPGVAGTRVGLIMFVLAAIVLFMKRSTTSIHRQIGLLCSSLFAALLAVWLLPEVRFLNDATRTATVVEGLLAGVYHAAVQPETSHSVEQLSEYLCEDLVEEVYLSTIHAMVSSETGEVFIDLESVTVLELSVSPPDQTNRLQTRCTWRVRGTVHHWGHAHLRELVSTGEIGLIRDDERWRICSVSLTETSGISVPDANPDDS